MGADMLKRLQALLAEEMRLHEGSVPERLPDPIREASTFAISADSFLLKLKSGLRFLYRRGEGVIYQRPTSVPDRDVAVFLNGSVYAGVAYLNGMILLHASAVLHGGKVHAFTAPSGGGKSTLAAGLSARGFTVFSDDIVTLVPNGAGPIQCLPGPSRIKLWSDALDLTGLVASDFVRADLGKFYVESESIAAEPTPLGSLFTLSDRTQGGPRFSRLKGGERFNAVRTAYYRHVLYAALTPRHDYLAMTARIGGAAPVIEFDRAKRREQFWAGVDVIANTIRRGDAGP